MSNGEDLKADQPNVESAKRYLRGIFARLRAICEDVDSAYAPQSEKAQRAHEALQLTDQALFALGVSQAEINQLMEDTVPEGEQRIHEILKKNAEQYARDEPNSRQAEKEHEAGE